MPVSARDERGFTMIMTVIGITLVALLAAVAVTAVSGSTQLTGRDLYRKQAYEAAISGVNEYAYHLHANSAYWAECTKPTERGEPSALNQEGSTANLRAVPGGSGATYAIELLPAHGHTECDATNQITASASMLEGPEPMRGTFRIRSTGFMAETQVSVVATFKPASFLDYVYFTQLETSDPVTYGKEELIKAADRQCTKTIYEGRYLTPLKNEKGEYLSSNGTVTTNPYYYDYCDTISFVTGDNIKGPMHTNDAFVICGSPTLGRYPEDPVEVSYPEKPGWFSTSEIGSSGSGCSGSESNFKGTYEVNRPALIPPETNSELEAIAEPTFRFKGEIKVCLEGSTITVGRGSTCKSSVAYSGAFPANGVIYDSNETCNGEYTPFNLAYDFNTASACGNVVIEKSTYAKPLTIAAANDVLIKGNVEKSSEEGMLGLIANNFIRIYHPVQLVHPQECTWFLGIRKCTENVNAWECTGNAAGALENVNIEAALLAINHSFIVDNYNCGAKLGTLKVTGAIAQKFRGAVGTGGGYSSGTGYLKNYEYDERLKTTEPPSFIEPIKSDWVIGRETTE